MVDRKRNDIAIDIEAMLEKVAIAEPSIPVTRCIYKVPHEIRKQNEDAYTPKVVSIGPFHHENQTLQKMENQKQIYLKKFLVRTKVDLDDLVSYVELEEPNVRRCYSENFYFSSKYFVRMILLDAAFILQFFFELYHGEDWTTPRDGLHLKSWLKNDIIKDLYLLENQLPFFVLEKLYNLAGDNLPETFLEFAFRVYGHHGALVQTQCYHFTDLLRMLYLQPNNEPQNKRKFRGVGSVTEFREAGVKFMALKSGWYQLGLRFSGRSLKMPQLIVDGETETLFRNMIAFEQCYYPGRQYITDYVFLLSCLIKTDEDADVLVKNRIIVNHLNCENDVVRLFYSLGKKTPVATFSSGYFNQLCGKLNKFYDYESPKTKIIASFRRYFYLDLKRNYCKTPLQTLATLGF